jgi:hypothetical protein
LEKIIPSHDDEEFIKNPKELAEIIIQYTLNVILGYNEQTMFASLISKF